MAATPPVISKRKVKPRKPRKPSGTRPVRRVKSECHHGPTNTYSLTTPIGTMELISCPRGIHTLGQLNTINDDNFTPKPDQEVCIKTQLFKDNGYTYKPALKCVEWLKLYFKKDPTLHTIPLPAICFFLGRSKKGATFTSQVLHNLAHKIKYGQTVSYGALGKLSGSPSGACRAVGQAMRNNPVQILIPCHRVIEASGKIGNYSGGSKNNTKVWLLQLEGVLKT